MTTTTVRQYRDTTLASPLPTGRWLVDADHSSAEFTARLAGRPIRGQVPLTGEVFIAPRVENSTARLVAAPKGLRTGHGVLDRLLVGAGFLHAEHFPEIAFHSQALVCVPIGWRAIGHLEVKGREHLVVCELAADLRNPPRANTAIKVQSRWAIDSTWITHQRVLTLSRRVEMTCTLALHHQPGEH
jgi:polyisoprenoid-binding protein YceI